MQSFGSEETRSRTVIENNFVIILVLLKWLRLFEGCTFFKSPQWLRLCVIMTGLFDCDQDGSTISNYFPLGCFLNLPTVPSNQYESVQTMFLMLVEYKSNIG